MLCQSLKDLGGMLVDERIKAEKPGLETYLLI
jgi:hypothetical protein